LSAVIVFALCLKLLLNQIVHSWRQKNSDEVKRYFGEWPTSPSFGYSAR
jgi:hypothetical protein